MIHWHYNPVSLFRRSNGCWYDKRYSREKKGHWVKNSFFKLISFQYEKLNRNYYNPCNPNYKNPLFSFSYKKRYKNHHPRPHSPSRKYKGGRYESLYSYFEVLFILHSQLPYYKPYVPDKNFDRNNEVYHWCWNHERYPPFPPRWSEPHY